MRRAPAYPLLRLVSDASTSADERFDFNDGDSWTVAGIDFGSPQILGAPDAINPEYDYRQVSFRVNMVGSENEVYSRCEQLARALMRHDNYLMFQLSAFSPLRWLKLLRSTPGAVSPVRVKRDGDVMMWSLSLSLIAEPFALGAQVSHTVTIGNDPATGGLAAVLPEISGDAPAPLVVEMPPGATAYVQPLVSVAPLDAEWPGVVVVQAESFTLSGSAVVAASATSSGGSRIEFGGETSWTRIMASDVSVPFAGQWRAFIRAQVTSLGPSGDIPSYSLRGAGDACSESRTARLYEMGATWLDLGIFTFPKGNPPIGRPYVIGAGQVAVEVRVDAGTPFVAADAVILMPADLPLDQAAPVTTLDVVTDKALAGAVVVRIDGETEQVELVDGGVHRSVPPTTNHGIFPSVAPGAANVLHLLTRRRGSSGAQDSITDSTTLTLTYRPRFVYLPGA